MNSFDNLKEWYNTYENEKQIQITVRLNTVIVTKVNTQSINDVDLTTRSQISWGVMKSG